MHGIVVIGVSAGGLRALEMICSALEPDLRIPILIVQHTSPNSGSYMAEHLDELAKLSVVMAEDKMKVDPGVIYIAPGGYHMFLESDEHICLSIDERVCYARPSIDVLFESVADILPESMLGIVLTGANSDGTNGARAIKAVGGRIVAQDPATADSAVMPLSVIEAGLADEVLALPEIAQLINQYAKQFREGL